MSRLHILMIGVAVAAWAPVSAMAQEAPLVLNNATKALAPVTNPAFAVSDEPFFPDRAGASTASPVPAPSKPVAPPVVAPSIPAPVAAPVAPVPAVPKALESKDVKIDRAVTADILNAPQTPLPKAPPPPVLTAPVSAAVSVPVAPAAPPPILKMPPMGSAPAQAPVLASKAVPPVPVEKNEIAAPAPLPFSRPLAAPTIAAPAAPNTDEALSRLIKESADLKKQIASLQNIDTARAQLEIKNAALTAQLDQQAAALEAMNTRLAEAQQKGQGDANTMARLEKLTDENIRLRAQLAQMSEGGSTGERVAVAAEQPLRLQLRDLQAERDVLLARQTELQRQLEDARRASEKSGMTGIDKTAANKDLAKAIGRYQEAEREVARLSVLMKEDRARCAADKKQIEYMLFDPKLAKDGQIAVLNSLEDELAATKAGKPTTSRMVPVASPVSMPTPQLDPISAATAISRDRVDDLLDAPVAPVAKPAAPLPAPVSVPAPVASSRPPQTQSANPIKVAAGPSKRWRALQGASMKEVLRAWADEANVQLIWRASQDFQVQRSINRTSDYASAVQALLEQQSGAGLQPIAHMYRDPKTGAITLVVAAERRV